MISLFGEVSCDKKPRQFADAQPHANVVFQMATWYAPELRWKIWPAQYTSRQRVEQEVMDFAAIAPRGHTHYAILEIRLPGL